MIDRHLAVAGSALLQVGPDGQHEQVSRLMDEYDDLLAMAVREFDRGALVQIDRAAGTPA